MEPSACGEPAAAAGSSPLEGLPEPLLLEVVSFLGFVEGHRWLGASKALHGRARESIDAHTRTLALGARERQALVLDRPVVTSVWLRSVFRPALREALVALDLSGDPFDDGAVGGAGTDGLLHVAFAQQRLFPCLEHLGLRGSDGLTDFGLRCLDPLGPHSHSAARAAQPVSPLVSLDIAFCPNTTYQGTLFLRDETKFPALELIRRQPEWLDGHFETPFANAAGSTNRVGEREVHTYYADGSFSFNRDFQSNGFVCALYPWAEDFVGDKLQYNNFRTPLGWPEYTQFCYRPGVCLLRLDPSDDDDDDEACPSVLVGQYMRCIRAPRERELLEAAKRLVPLGESRFFDKTTHEMLPPDDNPEDRDHRHNPHHRVMVSRMRLRPLAGGAAPRPHETHRLYASPLMPPRNLVRACSNTCAGLQSYDAAFLQRHEAHLHALLSADHDAHPDDA